MAGSYEQKDLTGSLFKNTDKKSDNHPDYNGSILVGGQPYWLNAWLKTAKNGTKYMSLSMKPKEAKGASHGGGGRPQQAPRSQQSYDEQRGGGRQGGGDARHSRDYDRPIDDEVPF